MIGYFDGLVHTAGLAIYHGGFSDSEPLLLQTFPFGSDVSSITFYRSSLIPCADFVTAVDTPIPSIEFVSDLSNANENTGAHQVLVKLRLPGGGLLGSELSVEVMDSGLGTAIPGSDYAPFPPTVITFAAGSIDGTTKSVTVEIQDNIDSGDDTTIEFQINNLIGSGASGPNISHTVTIIDDDSFPPIAEDDETETGKGQDVTVDVLANDTDADGTLDPSTLFLVQPRYVANFDGVDDKIAWGNLELDGTARISKFIRFRTTRASGVLFDFELKGGFDGGFAFRHGNLQLRCGFQNLGVKVIDVVPAVTATDGQWHSVGFTYDGSTLTAYFDGLASGTPAAVIGGTIPHNYTTIVGRRTLSNTMFFQGQLSDFVVYNQALSAEAVMSYHQGNGAPGDAVLLAAMDENDYSIGLADASGNGHVGTDAGAIPIIDQATPAKPENGTVLVNGDGTVTYTPNSGFTGLDSFEYTVEDMNGTISNSATATITVSPMLTLLAAGQQTISKQAIKDVDNGLIPATPTAPLFSESFTSRTVYEDAEDGGIAGWHVYGEGRVMNQEDSSGNRIISVEGNIHSDPFRLGLNDGNDWNNATEFTAYFTILMEEDAAVYFRVDTSDGEKYLCYNSGSETLDNKNDIIHLGLDIQADGQWHTIVRDLAKDINTALPSAQIISVKDFYIYGSVNIDEIMLIDLAL